MAAQGCPAMSQVRNVFRFQWFLPASGGSSSAGKPGPQGNPEQQRKRNERFTHLPPPGPGASLGGRGGPAPTPVPAPSISPLAPSAPGTEPVFPTEGAYSHLRALHLSSSGWDALVPVHPQTFAQRLSAQRGRPDHLAKAQASLPTSSSLTLAYHTQHFSLPRLTFILVCLLTYCLLLGVLFSAVSPVTRITYMLSTYQVLIKVRGTYSTGMNPRIIPILHTSKQRLREGL